MDLGLAGKRAIVTGGTGGIGIAIARQLALEGVHTAVCGRSLPRAADAVASLDVPGAAELLMPAQVELKDPGSVAAMRVCRAAVPLMRAQKFGRIINLAGSTAREAGSVSAGARNSAVVNLTKALAREFGRDGITVNAIHPFTTVTGNLGPRLERMAARRGRLLLTHRLQESSVMTSTAPAAGEQSDPSVLDALLRPRSVALIGASRDPRALGGRPLAFIARYGFPGKVYPVNGSAPQVQGLPSYASIKDVPEPVDLALVMVRAELVAQVLRDCAASGVRVAAVVSSGFGEGMGAGEGILESVAPELAASGMRVLGPNCEGLASLPADAPLTFSPVLDIDASGTRLRPGNIAVLSQSGGLGFAVAQWGTEAGLDFSYVISTGNEFDLDCVELAGHLVELPDTDTVIMLIEAFRDLAEFARVAGRFRQAGKRLVVAKLGKTAPGARGAYAHTRHVAGDLAEYTRLFRAYDVLEADGEEELIDVVQATAKTRRLGLGPLPPGARVGIATTSGGAGVWLADACAARGLEVPVLSPPLQEAMKGHMPPFGSPANPVDLTAQLTTGGTVVPALRLLAGSGEVDAVVLATSLSSAGRLERDSDALAGLIRASKLPVFVFSYTRPAPSCVQILKDLGVPWYTSAARAARGLAALVQGAAVQEAAVQEALVPEAVRE